MRREDFDVWYDKFSPILVDSDDPNEGSPRLYETYGDDVKHVLDVYNRDKNLVWTILDCDGKLYLSPGFHIVNRLNYIICTKPYDEKTRDYKY